MSVITLPLQNFRFDDVEVKVQHHVYSAFGKLLKVEDGNGVDVTDAPVIDPYFTYTGRELDKETGLYYYRARYYDSSTGRFISVDPHPGYLKDPLTFLNKYIYALNDPVNLVDPFGLFSFKKYFSNTWDYLRKGDISGYLSSPELKLMVTTAVAVAGVYAAVHVAAVNPQAGFILASASIGALFGGATAYDEGGNVYKSALQYGATAGVAATGAVLGGYVAGHFFAGSAAHVFAGSVGGGIWAGTISGVLTGLGAKKGAIIGLSVGVTYGLSPMGPIGGDQLGSGGSGVFIQESSGSQGKGTIDWSGGRLNIRR